MATIYTQANRALKVTTPLAPDTLLLIGFRGQEDLSQLFQYQLDLLAENGKDVAFDKLLGQPVSIALALPGGESRSFCGICSRFSQGARDTFFTSYQLEMVPALWLLTRRAQSRIFQHLSVPDILKKVLDGLPVSWEIQGTFQPRDYCVQYRETDFNFASRLMEEEGIYYFFKHEGGHKMVVANTPGSHPDMPQEGKLIFDAATGGNRPEERIYSWEKVQELRSGQYTLWDHTFEKPHKHLEADKAILDSVAAGKVTHKQALGANAKLELYDYPGGYAQRFGGVDKGGGDRPAEVEKIFEDNKRTVGIRMQQEAVPGLVVHGSSNCRQLVPGHKFTLERHFNADGPYLLTGVQHSAKLTGDYRTNGGGEFRYENRFSCIPFAQPYRPQRTTPKPSVRGTQTAVVVGPKGEEIFTDKYGRVKAQFHWDRQGKYDAGSSCWVRVATPWAGKKWGMIHIPRIGQEVVVDFLEGDPDQPIIVGSVYNADQMPPYQLPDNRTQSGIKTRSSLGGSPANFNEIRFEDQKGQEQLFIHAEKNQDIEVENDETHWVGRDRKKTIDHDETTHVKHDRTETVDHNETITIGNDRAETVLGFETIAVAKDRTRTVSMNESVTVTLTRTHTVGVNEAITVGGAQEVTVGAMRAVSVGVNQMLAVGRNLTETVGKDHKDSVGGNRTTAVGKDDALSVGKTLTVDAGDKIVLQTGQSSITMKKDGTGAAADRPPVGRGADSEGGTRWISDRN
jgi:type VI secretion system secreted protein VgrG